MISSFSSPSSSQSSISTKLPVLVFLRSALDWTPLPPEGLHRIVLGGSVANIEVSLPLGGPGSAVTKLPHHATVVAVIDGCMVPEMI